MIQEFERKAPSGIVTLLALLVLLLGCIAGFVLSVMEREPGFAITCVVGFLLTVFLLTGLFTVAPNQGRVLQLFGRYVGTVRDPGLRWTNPFYTKRAISLRVRNFDSDTLWWPYTELLVGKVW